MIRFACPAAVLATAALALAPAAGAATLSVSSGTLAYDAADGKANIVTFDQTGASAVHVTRETAQGDDDPVTAGTGCTASGSDQFDCTGVSSVVANGRDRDDTFEAAGAGGGLSSLPANFAGGAGDDILDAGAGNDLLKGDEGNDTLFGNGGDDRLDGAADDDFLNPGIGNDVASGGDGDDQFLNNFSQGGGPDADSFNGGDGFDTIAETADTGGANPTPVAVSVTLDGQPNDGAAGENDNVLVERVNDSFFGTNNGNDTLVGDSGTNALDGGPGNDTVDGGPGNDRLQGGTGNDAIRARDGYADVVTCGPGADSAVVDSLDTVSSDCESVDRTDVGNATEDRPPAVRFTAPGPGATMSTRQPTQLVVDATDDHGIAKIEFYAGARLICTVGGIQPCAYLPRGEDAGRTVLTAIAFDDAGQTGTAIQPVVVDTFAAPLSARLTPARDGRAPYRFRVTGRLSLPPTVTAAQGCASGVVSVQVKAGSRTISTRRANLRRDCTYALSVAFADRRRFRSARSLRFTARFAGNPLLKPARAASRNGRIR